jgi:eukaryotic-like serine/threonine-protein kinase
MTDVHVAVLEALADRYRLERELGHGGMGIVYLARDLRWDRPVAVKLLRPELAVLVGPERFAREVRITAHLQHPHILPVLKAGEATTMGDPISNGSNAPLWRCGRCDATCSPFLGWSRASD